MTNHVSFSQLLDYLFDNASLSAAEGTHLAACTHCQSEITRLNALAAELKVARASQPTAASLNRYYGAFAQAPQRPSLWSGIVEWVQAQLAIDTRRQIALQGMRSMAATTYRLLYSAELADVELMVDLQSAGCHVRGVIMAVNEQGTLGSALVQTLDSAGVAVAESEVDGDGHFQLAALQPGRYTLVITPTDAPALILEGVELE